MYITLGIVSVGLGIIGVLLPVMPGTIFFIMSAYFFGKSSDRLEQWILTHPKYGPPVVRWQKYRAINRAGKKAALLGMSIGVVSLLIAQVTIWIKLAGIVFIISCAVYVATRPSMDD